MGRGLGDRGCPIPVLPAFLLALGQLINPTTQDHGRDGPGFQEESQGAPPAAGGEPCSSARPQLCPREARAPPRVSSAAPRA